MIRNLATPDHELTWPEVHDLEELEDRLCGLLGSAEDVLHVADRLERHQPIQKLRRLLRLMADGLHAPHGVPGFWSDLDDLIVRGGSTHARMGADVIHDTIPF